MTIRSVTTALLGSLLAFAGTASAQTPSADVTYQDILDVANFGPETVNGSVMYSYIYGTATCNVGNRNLNWGNATQGSPIVFFNLFRYHDGRLQQIGASWGKTACCAGAGTGCGTCNGAGGSVLGAGCRDVYGSGFNQAQSRLGARSATNPWSGQQAVATTYSGTSVIARRCGVKRDDMDPARYPGASFFGDGVYVANDEVNPTTRLNNASYRRLTISAAYQATVSGTTVQGQPAIMAWRTLEPSTLIVVTDAPNDGRYYVASKARDLGNGQWRYDYAVYNLNSHNAAASFRVPLSTGVRTSNPTFYDIGVTNESYATTDWANSRDGCSISWVCTETFAQNPNANALRFGTMYNFWFDANVPPVNTGTVSIGLFRVAGSITATGLVVPGRAQCIADVDNGMGTGIPDGGVTIDDLLFFLTQYENGTACTADVDNGTATGTPDGGVTIDDLLYYLDRFAAGC